MRPAPRAVISTLFLTIFLDLVGFGIVVPILGPLLLSSSSVMFPPGATEGERTLVYGLLIAAYPFAQFFGAPMLGALADHRGRKPILFLSVLGSTIGYALAGYAVLQGSLLLLFVSRLVSGFTGGNISVAQSAIADISETDTKTKNFGVIGMAFGLGLVLGPFIGGILADKTLHPWFTTATPFWFAVGLSVLTMLSILTLLPETLHTSVRTEISLMTGFRNIRKAFELKHLRTILIVSFFLTIGFTLFTQFFLVLLVERFAYTERQIGNIFGYVGLWFALVQGLMAPAIAKRHSPERTLKYCAFFLGITIPLLLLPRQSWVLYVILPFIALFEGLAYPNMTAIISNLSGNESQGEVLGINQSLQALGMIVPAIVGGFVAAAHVTFPMILAGIATLIGWLIFVAVFHEKPSKLFHEVS